ncbi:MAG: hypothetical protein Q9194_002844 [Teloschistes cf. exilis]
MSAHRPSKIGTGGLDDPFVVARGDREDKSAAPVITQRVLSEDGETTGGESSTAFDDAILWFQVESGVHLPSAPKLRERKKHKSSNHQSPEQRPSRRSLSANATPFRPKPESDQTGNSSKQSIDYASPLYAPAQGKVTGEDMQYPNILNIAYGNNQFRNEMLNQTGQGTFQTDRNGDSPHSNVFDHYTPTPSVSAQNHSTPTTQINPYAQDGSTMSSSAYFPGSTSYPQQLQHHLYAALPPHRDLNQPNQRTAKDLFIPENLRQTLARKTEANLMTIPNSSLPAIAHYHSLVPLIHNSQKNAGVFGYLSHAYKATSGNDGKAYCLRRLQGYRLNEAASIHAVQNVQSNWKRVRNGNVVSVHLAFTNSSFGDSSLFFVTDFHPMAETLTQKHFTSTPRYNNRFGPSHVPEQTLWAYIVQIANGLKAIHSAGLAARVIDASKILLTGQNRIRLNGCAILDVVRADTHQALADLQGLDLQHFGKLIVALGSNNMLQHNQAKAMEMFSKSYSPRLRELSSGLIDPSSPDRTTTIDKLLAQITTDVVLAFDSSLHQDDALESALVKELENSRLVRLLSKINFINERPEYEHDRHWAEHGNRFVIRLFRDYVFHQVDANGNPVLDLAHVLGALNRLDAASEEKVCLMTRDEESVIVVSFKEVRTERKGERPGNVGYGHYRIRED